MDIRDITVTMIAEGLKVRKKLQGPTLLFLGARAGALFRSKTLYDELRPFSQRPFATLNEGEKFQTCVRLLEQDRFSETDAHYILLRSLQDIFVQDIDIYVAALVKLNFFQLIVTTNIDVGLEAALGWIGLSMKSDFDVFIPSIRSSSPVPSFSKQQISSKPTLVKLYGELAMGHYSLKHRDKHFGSSTQLYQQLQEMHNWNILMVGFDSLWDAAIMPLLFPCTGKLWYVNEETPTSNSLLFQSLQHSNAQCLLGTKGDSEKFFQSLHQYIVGSAPLPSLALPVEPPPAKSRLSTPHRLQGKVEQSTVRAKSTHYKVDVLLLATTERELTALLKQHHGNITRHIIQGRTCYGLGKVGDATVSLVQADEMGKTLDTLGEQIQELSPACIIIVGMAWGFKYKGQYIGNLLIPDRILISDIERENRNKTFDSDTDAYLQMGRNQKAVPMRPLNLFKNGNLILNKKTKRLVAVTFGPLFSNTKATDPQTAFRYVSRNAPDVIGIETGTTALFSLAQSYQENCLLVKVVSALVDVNEATNQEAPDPEPTLENAAQFILDVIALGGFHQHQAQ